jgi:hypothetical protein
MDAAENGEVIWPDMVNGLLELAGAAFIAPSIMRARRTRSTGGAHWVHPLFFAGWGFWNLFYYPSLEQPFSTVGAVFVLVANLFWLHYLWLYWRRL